MASSITIEDDDVTIKSDEYMFAEYQKALQAVQQGKSYSITGSRSLTRNDLDEIQKMYSFYENRVLIKKGGSSTNLGDVSRYY